GDQSVIGNAGFTNDAQYITAADLPPIPSPLTFENGLREDGGVVKLGLDVVGGVSGALTEDTTVLVNGDLAGESLSFIISKPAGLISIRSMTSPSVGASLNV